MVSSNANSLVADENTRERLVGLKGIYIFMTTSRADSERIILYMLHAAAIFSPCHPYIWSTILCWKISLPDSLPMVYLKVALELVKGKNYFLL